MSNSRILPFSTTHYRLPLSKDSSAKRWTAQLLRAAKTQSEISISLASSIRINSDGRFNSLSSDPRRTARDRMPPAQSGLSSETATRITRGSPAGTLCKRNFSMSLVLGGDVAWRNNASASTFEATPFRIRPVGSSLSKRAFVLSRHASSGLHASPFCRFWRNWRKTHSRICHLSCIGGDVSGKQVVLEIKEWDNGRVSHSSKLFSIILGC
ncbi:hypothetical protein CDAR_622101 [Caerostris darwini]|uniref:Uncharacterized protein n=1 Tax=Caerostris darwini TaxID=1538125 RepID=A0AAV4RWU6_9ARAC|nr:hypothetical protein CDAR_622101 [Caerostris darwini]